MIHIEPWQWLLAAVAAAGIGISKTGIAGLGIVSIAIFAILLPARESVGVVLPILLCGDIVAVTAYRRHAVWFHLWRLFPWAAAGIILGSVTMGHISDSQVSHLIGVILLVLAGVQTWRKSRMARARGNQISEAEENTGLVPDPSNPIAATSNANQASMRRSSAWMAPALGLLAGFATMVANAAGPILILYLLAMRLEKMEFIGTAAWYFLALNLFKVPFNLHLGLINASSLRLDAVLGPITILGAFLGRWILPRIDQAMFETTALALTAAAAIKLVFF